MLTGDSRGISLLKTATWYCSDALLTGVTAFIVTRDVKVSIGIAGLQQTLELILYYVHERVWVRAQACRGGR